MSKTSPSSEITLNLKLVAKFTVRIELHDVHDNAEEYEILHQSMETSGFSRTITDSKSGTIYKLPRAEYNAIGNYTREKVMAVAKAATKKTGRDFSVLVTPSPGRYWYNLEKSEEDESES
jgi:hypothetical protein